MSLLNNSIPRLTMNNQKESPCGSLFVSYINTLYTFNFKKKFKAGDGERGSKSLCHGKDGEDEIIVSVFLLNK